MASLLTTDEYIDIDEMVATYHRKKSTVLFLVAALTLIFFGTLTGFSMLEYQTAKLDNLSHTTLEFAQETANSDKCKSNPEESVCARAKIIVNNPELIVKDSSFPSNNNGKHYPIEIATVPYQFHADPATQMIAILLTQPVILRLQ